MFLPLELHKCSAVLITYLIPLSRNTVFASSEFNWSSARNSDQFGIGPTLWKVLSSNGSLVNVMPFFFITEANILYIPKIYVCTLVICLIKRINHWCSLATVKSQPERSPFKWETRLCRVSHLNGGTEGWDLLSPMNTIDGFCFSHTSVRYCVTGDHSGHTVQRASTREGCRETKQKFQKSQIILVPKWSFWLTKKIHTHTWCFQTKTSSPKGTDRSPESNVPRSNLISKNSNSSKL